MKKEETLLDSIKQYAKILYEIKKIPKYWDLKQYTSVWHYLDGMCLSYFIFTKKIIHFDTKDGQIEIMDRMEV